MKYESVIKSDRFCFATALSLTVLIYYFLHLKYWIYYVDDSWTLTYVYAYMIHGLDMDLVFRPETSDRVFLYFGKTYHFLYGNIFNFAGWTKSNALIISTVFIFLNAFLWYVITGILGFSKQLRFVNAFAILLFPAFFSSANMARPDTMTLFFIFLTFFLFLKEFYFLAGFFMFVGFENHIMGAVSFFYLTGYVVYKRNYFLTDKKVLFRQLSLFAAGALTGLCYYLLLHIEQFSIEKITKVMSENRTMGYPISNYIVSYFFSSDFHRHLVEFVFVFVSIVIYIRKKFYKDNRFTAIFGLTMIISTFITKRPNHNYMLFIYPGILLAVFYTHEKLGFLKKTASLCLVYFIFHYGLIYGFAYGFDFEKINEKTRSYLTDEERVVVGMPDNWFASMDRTFYPVYPSAKDFTKKEFDKAYFIRNDYLSKHSRNYDEVVKYFENNFEMKMIARFKAYRDYSVVIYECERKQISGIN